MIPPLVRASSMLTILAVVSVLAAPRLAAGATVTVPHLKGAGSPACRPVIEGLLDPAHSLIDGKRFTGPEGRPEPDDLLATRAWLLDRADVMPEVRVAVLGARLGRGKLRLDVYGLPKVRLIAIKTLDVDGRCRLRARERRLAAAWLQKAIESETSGRPWAEVASRPPSPPSDPAVTAAATPGPPTTPGTGTATVVAVLTRPPPVPGPGTRSPPTAGTPPSLAADPALAAVPRPDPPPRAETEPEAPGPSEASEPSPSGAPSTRRTVLGLVPIGAPVLRLYAGVALLGRSFRHDAPRDPALRDFELGGAPVPALELETYPFAAVAGLRGLGLRAALRRSFGVESVRSDGGPDAYPTRLTDLDAELRYRWALGAGETGPAIVPRVGYRATAFATEPSADGARETELPDVAYGSLAGGLDVEVPLSGRLSILGGGAYLAVLLRGDGLRDGAFQPRTEVSGFELHAAAELALARAWALRAGARFTRYFLQFEGADGRPARADGARDEWLGFGLGLVWSP